MVIRAHETHLHQTPATGDLGFDDVPAAFGSDGQRLFAEHRLACGDGRQHVLFMAGAPRADQYRLDIRRGDQCVPVGIHFGAYAQITHHVGCLLQIDVGDGHHLTADQCLAATPDMILTDCACADHAEFQCHVQVPFFCWMLPVIGDCHERVTDAER